VGIEKTEHLDDKRIEGRGQLMVKEGEHCFSLPFNSAEYEQESTGSKNVHHHKGCDTVYV
jgi:hypothetical protein